jgi:hypothetical protein
MIVYHTQNFLVSGLHPSSGILREIREHNVLETGSVSFLIQRETPLFGALERANLDHCASHVSTNTAIPDTKLSWSEKNQENLQWKLCKAYIYLIIRYAVRYLNFTSNNSAQVKKKSLILSVHIRASTLC